jgi:surface protein
VGNPVFDWGTTRLILDAETTPEGSRNVFYSGAIYVGQEMAGTPFKFKYVFGRADNINTGSISWDNGNDASNPDGDGNNQAVIGVSDTTYAFKFFEGRRPSNEGNIYDPNATFSIDENGIIKCRGVAPGRTGLLFGDTYVSVDKNMLIQGLNEGADLTKYCVSNVSDMSQLFGDFPTFNQAIGNWDVSNVATMIEMFSGSSFNQNISYWSVGNVTDMTRMFQNSKFNQAIGEWDVSNVTNMVEMFSGSVFNQSIENWDVSSVTYMSAMFQNSKFNQPIDKWIVSNVTSMAYLFSNSEFNHPINTWDVSRVTNMMNMFFNSPFNFDLSDWNVSQVTNMTDMFGFSKFNHSLEKWDVSNVITMDWMFEGSSFNQPIGNWDVSNVTTMEGMFDNSIFNQPIENWNTENVTNMSSMFGNSKFNQPIGNWDVRNVTAMQGMFYYSLFNQPLNTWEVSKVGNMSSMFQGSSFNQPIGDWKMSSVTIMNGMFHNSQFNQPINEWCVTQITSEPSNFSTNSPLAQQNKPVWGTCPGKPSKILLNSPHAGTIGINSDTEFKWFKDEHAQTYQFQLFEGFNPIVVDQSVPDTSYENTLSLKPSLDYYWRVRGVNDDRGLTGEWSSIWKITTSNNPNNQKDIQVTLLERWNLVGISVQADHTNFSQLFPNAAASTLFAYTNTYQNKETLEPGKGYWIRTNQAGSTTLRGAPIESLNLELQTGWNLISGPSESVAVSNIEDSDEIIIPGSIFGFNGSYVNATNIEAGRGYWVRTNQAGTITLSGGTATKTTQSHPSMALSGFDRIEFLSGTEEKPVSTLYLNGSIPTPYSAINFELPPVPPVGNVDVRWEHGSYVSESAKAVALVQQGASPLVIKVPELFADEAQSGSNSGLVSIREFVGDQLIKEAQIQRGELFTLSGQTNRIEFELQEKTDLPTEFTLDQNYPNPFNPTTTIRFGLPESAEVSLEVYTVLGQKVMTLVNENRSAGWHTVSFNGAGLSSGVYVYRIQAGGYVSTKKFMLVK